MPLGIHSGTYAATCPPLLLAPSLPRAGILRVAGPYGWAKIVTWHRTGPCLLCFPAGINPQGVPHPWAEELGLCDGVCLPTLVRVRGGVDHGRGACPLQFDLSSCLRSQDLGRRRERQTRGWGGEQEQQQKNLICTVRAFEPLLLQYTLTKIESHFISIQQQQKKNNSFLDCYTANFSKGCYLQLQ